MRGFTFLSRDGGNYICPVIDELLKSPKVGLLKRYRHGVFHFQGDYFDKRFTDFMAEGQSAVDWVSGRSFLSGMRLASEGTKAVVTAGEPNPITIRVWRSHGNVDYRKRSASCQERCTRRERARVFRGALWQRVGRWRKQQRP